jgi:hypothetical protein
MSKSTVTIALILVFISNCGVSANKYAAPKKSEILAIDSTQVEMIKKLHNKKLANKILAHAEQLKGAFVNHFFNEVFINGKWIRCNYNNVNIGCLGWCGPLINENIFADFSGENYARTWEKDLWKTKEIHIIR